MGLRKWLSAKAAEKKWALPTGRTLRAITGFANHAPSMAARYQRGWMIDQGADPDNAKKVLSWEACGRVA